MIKNSYRRSVLVPTDDVEDEYLNYNDFDDKGESPDKTMFLNTDLGELPRVELSKSVSKNRRRIYSTDVTQNSIMNLVSQDGGEMNDFADDVL